MADVSREIVLFREPRANDPYERAFAEAGFSVRFVPVLRFDPINADALSKALASPESYAGIVVTSERAARCVVESGVSGLWAGKPVYSVGPRTAEVLTEGGFEVEHPRAGTGSDLARIVIERHAGELPLLFPCGTRRRDELPALLKDAGIPLEELAVYETTPEEVIGVKDQPEPAWTVFFSPSGVETVGASIRRYWPVARRAAIGPTTAAALDESGMPAHAVATSPDPASLVEAVRSAG
ncbi:MAG TPA: uroporphyrinogen-III synthase [Rhodothermales bacterium]